MAAPTAHFTYSPPQPFEGDLVSFDGSGSLDSTGRIVLYHWVFGDGATGSGVTTQHVYANTGTFNVTLTVTNEIGEKAATTRTVVVGTAPPLPLVSFSHPSGFRLPIPVAWDAHEDEDLQGLRVELALYGPISGAFQTNILVDTDRDPTVREDRAFMEEVAREGFEQIKSGSPDAILYHAASHFRIANHSAVGFTVRYMNPSLVQRFVIVVSDPHDRFWNLLFTTTPADYFVYNGTFAAMVDGFEITTEPTPVFSPILAVSILGGVAAAVTVAVLLVLRRARRKPAAVQLRPCPFCGAGTPEGLAACSSCGRPLSDPTSPTTPPPPPPGGG